MMDSEATISAAGEHVRMAKDQREYVNQKMEEAAATQLNEPSERVWTFIGDYAQNLQLPNFGCEQPGETYYYSPLNILCFGYEIAQHPCPLWYL